jgi:hypothetical protein
MKKIGGGEEALMSIMPEVLYSALPVLEEILISAREPPDERRQWINTIFPVAKPRKRGKGPRFDSSPTVL